MPFISAGEKRDIIVRLLVATMTGGILFWVGGYCLTPPWYALGRAGLWWFVLGGGVGLLAGCWGLDGCGRGAFVGPALVVLTSLSIFVIYGPLLFARWPWFRVSCSLSLITCLFPYVFLWRHERYDMPPLVYTLLYAFFIFPIISALHYPGPDAIAPNTAELGAAPRLLAHLVEPGMERQDQRRVLGDAQIVRRQLDPLTPKGLDLVDQRPRIDDDAGPDDGELAGPHHA